LNFCNSNSGHGPAKLIETSEPLKRNTCASWIKSTLQKMVVSLTEVRNQWTTNMKNTRKKKLKVKSHNFLILKFKICGLFVLALLFNTCTSNHFSVGLKPGSYVFGSYTIEHKKHYSQHMIEFKSKVEDCSGILVLSDDNFQYLPNENVIPISFIKIETQKYQFCYYENSSLLLWHSNMLPKSSVEIPENLKMILFKIDSISLVKVPHYKSQLKYWAQLNIMGDNYYRNQYP
jgi:hypothetical protein